MQKLAVELRLRKNFSEPELCLQCVRSDWHFSALQCRSAKMQVNLLTLSSPVCLSEFEKLENLQDYAQFFQFVPITFEEHFFENN
jgi:hypothetical protein